MDDESLIICVQSRPAIFNKKDKLHHNRDYIQRQWESIADEMKLEVNAVKSRWGHIRDYFLKKYRENRNVKSGQAAKGKAKWHLYDALTFLIPVFEPRDTSSNLSQDEATETVQATDSLDMYSQASSPMTSRASSPSPQPPPVSYKRAQKRKVTTPTGSAVDEEILKTLQMPENDDELWARSLIPSLQKLRHPEKLEFRVEVQSLLLRYLRRQEEEEEARGFANYHPSQGAHGASNLNYSTSEEYHQQWMS